ncbi:GntR family transcriptional regulator [Streptomyces filamentosus]|uniref:HTH gntR-type domain-containing protein n=1 Tax=Streptomyces filamentosus TaxID=67294 RepID=A0A919EP96_STRFL|nr:GntR family transcriptional regulator [Streptomyces filamentosus]GHG05635.1 hypothetical protein GCM10017667_40630 [Streptomyces filamentosus]
MPPETLPIEFLRAAAEHQAPEAQLHALHLAMVRAHVTALPAGTKLPTLADLSAVLGITETSLTSALRRLDLEGEIAYSYRGHRYRLGPGEQHPFDVALDRAVRDGIREGKHRPGDALPTGILAQRHGLDVEAVPRALHGVIRDGLVTDRDGPAGRAFYVRDPQEAVLDQVRTTL